MPTTESAEYAKFNTLGLKKRPDSIQAEGRARYLNDVIVFAGGETTAGTVNLLPLPKGAMVDLSKSTIVTSDTITGVTVDIGTNGSTDNLADGLDIATAGTTVFDATAVDLVKAADATLLTIAGGTTSANDTIRVSICYYVR